MIARFTRKDFLDALFNQYYKEHRGFIMVKSVRRGDPKMSTRYFPNIEILAKEHYGEERDVYFGICPRERMKAEKEHIHYIIALWADLDIGGEGHEEKQIFFEGPQQAAKAIRSFPRAPSIIVESGRGAHLYWLLKQVTEVTDQEKVEKVLKNISEHLQCDTDVNLDTVLRLPETVNTKIPGKPVNCDVKFINPNFRYSLQDFENLGQRLVVPPPARPAAAPLAAVPQPKLSDEDVVFDEQAEPEYDTTLANQTLDDSLVLDETIIDELIDDISMAGSMVTDLPGQPATASFDEPIRPDERRSSRVVQPQARSQPAQVASSTFLAQLVAQGAPVEVAFVGAAPPISGVLVWNENGLIGVETGEDLYTIPLSSVSYIKSKA